MSYNIIFYETENHKSDIWDFLENLRTKAHKSKNET